MSLSNTNEQQGRCMTQYRVPVCVLQNQRACKCEMAERCGHITRHTVLDSLGSTFRLRILKRYDIKVFKPTRTLIIHIFGNGLT